MRPLVLLLCPTLLAFGETDTEVPGPAIVPQAITYRDIEANDLSGAGCAYASGTSMAPIVLANADQAAMKIGGQIQRFVVDSESEGAVLGSRTRYLAEDRVLYLTVEGEGTPARDETVNFTGSVRLLDGAGAELYATTGTVQCGS
jgi:hypothetical protein